MNQLVCFVVAYLVNSLWQAPLLGGAGWLVSRMLRKVGPQAQHAAWVTTFWLTIIIPALPFFRVLIGFTPNAANGFAPRSIVFISAQTSVESGSTVLPMALIWSLFWLNFCSLLYFGARLSFSLYQTWKLLKDSSSAVLALQCDETWNRCKRIFAVESAEIRVCGQVKGPVTLGLRRPVLLVPDGFSDHCTTSDFLSALGHECAHMKRHDFQKNLIFEIASLAISFHPVTWMLKSKIAETREMI